jgi:plastocyanin
MRRILTVAALLLIVTGSMAACGKTKSKTTTTTTAASSSVTTAASSSVTTAAAGGAALDIVATNFQFDKTALSAASGKAVTFTITNNGTVAHNLTIPELKINTDVQPGKTATATATPTKAGTFEYHCEYHPTQMKGTLTVS